MNIRNKKPDVYIIRKPINGADAESAIEPAPVGKDFYVIGSTLIMRGDTGTIKGVRLTFSDTARATITASSITLGGSTS